MDTNALVYGGIYVPAKLRSGADANVKLRLIKISEIPAFLDIAMDEATALAFCIEDPAFAAGEKGAVGQPVLDFADSLTDESFVELVQKNTDLNFTRALAMTDQRLKRAEAGGLELARVAGSLASLLNRYSPKSPSPAATPESRS